MSVASAAWIPLRRVQNLRRGASGALAPFVLLALIACEAGASGPTSPASVTTVYRGPCDASAAVALDAAHFAVGNDENDVVSVYRLGAPAAAAKVDLRTFLRTQKGQEADIEGAASIGPRTYWITSHGRNARGAYQASRHRFFATRVVPGHPPSVEADGTPYHDLLRDLVEHPPLATYRLDQASKLAAEAEGGLNIEGLAATPEGRLLIGFRNPLRSGRALVVPLDNPAEVVAGRRARLGAPTELDLGGRGIRSIELVGSAYYVVGGPIADRGTFALFRWSGRAGDAPVALPADLGTLRPEALFAVPGSDQLVLLSDDGGLERDGKECKDLKASLQHFRGMTVSR